ncbi:transporter substrate-binding domain-containing protein [Desulfobacterales bacterium HSG16]|nr:transporter substrate-binding domain-containing protein [Desulfobacterales bacterium HSG16]
MENYLCKSINRYMRYKCKSIGMTQKRSSDNLYLNSSKIWFNLIERCMPLAIVSIVFMGLLLVGCGDSKDPLTPEERAWLKQHDGKIIINNDAGWPPIVDKDKDGKLFGIAMDYQRLIEKKLNFKFQLCKFDSWENNMKKFRAGEIDVHSNLHKNPKRTKYALFTKPYIEIPNAIIVRKKNKRVLTLEMMRGMKIAITNGYAIHDFIKNNYDYLDLKPFDDDINCLLETSTKTVDAAVVNLAVASFFIEKEGISNLRIAGNSEYKNALSFASRKDLPLLNRILEKGLDLITQAEKDAIYRNWISLGLEYKPFYKNRRFWIVSGSIFGVISAIIITILILNQGLKRQVKLRTEKLNSANVQLKNEIAERNKTEEELRNSQQFNETILNTSPDIIYIYDILERVNIYSNKGITRVLGYSTIEIKNMGDRMIQNLMHPDDFLTYINVTLPKYQFLTRQQISNYLFNPREKYLRINQLYLH